MNTALRQEYDERGFVIVRNAIDAALAQEPPSMCTGLPSATPIPALSIFTTICW